MMVASRPIEVYGHQADRIKTVLLTQNLAKLEPIDLGERIPLICWLQRIICRASSLIGYSAYLDRSSGYLEMAGTSPSRARAFR